MSTIITELSMDDRVERVVDYLFKFQPPPDLALPVVPWDLFEIPKDGLRRDWAGLCRGEGLSGLHPDPKVFIWQEVAHIDLYFGLSTGPAGVGYATALASQDYGFNNLQAVLNPNCFGCPNVVQVTKVKTDTRVRANQMFGTAQSAVAEGLADCEEKGFFPSDIIYDLVGVVAVFIDPNAGAVFEDGKVKKDDAGKLVMLTGDEAAASNHRIYCFNYVSTIAASWMGVTGGRTTAGFRAARKKIQGHVLRGFAPKIAA